MLIKNGGSTKLMNQLFSQNTLEEILSPLEVSVIASISTTYIASISSGLAEEDPLPNK